MELRDLYQEVILDHNKHPRNFNKAIPANLKAEGFNPLCGDHITVLLQIKNNKICDISFEGSGCAISKASSSMMTEALIGKSKEEALKLFESFHAMLMSNSAETLPENLGKLAVFSGVWEFPARVKCASLAWHAVKSALEGKGECVTTEEADMREGA
ncbi:MAG: SUF system NifU family Fe-S cluster assembly protein [Deltaproteobacteria bacterium]|nr:SUF system NifU family Fe-S cluster assembly protein [Deltaproteobacteria bacterium]